MSATRRTLYYAVLAGCVWLAAILFTAATVKRPVVVLVPDTLGLPLWPVTRLDTLGNVCRLYYLPLTFDR